MQLVGQNSQMSLAKDTNGTDRPCGYNVGPKGQGARGGRKGEGTPPPIIRRSHHPGGAPG